MTDSIPLLKSIASTRRVENLNIVNIVEYLKENLLNREINSYSYVNTKDNVADLLTKYKTETQDFNEIFVNGNYTKGKKYIEVKLVKREQGDEIRLFGDLKESPANMSHPSNEHNYFSVIV